MSIEEKLANEPAIYVMNFRNWVGKFMVRTENGYEPKGTTTSEEILKGMEKYKDILINN